MPVIKFVTVIVVSAIVRTPAPGIKPRQGWERERATMCGSKALDRLKRREVSYLFDPPPINVR